MEPAGSTWAAGEGATPRSGTTSTSMRGTDSTSSSHRRASSGKFHPMPEGYPEMTFMKGICNVYNYVASNKPTQSDAAVLYPEQRTSKPDLFPHRMSYSDFVRTFTQLEVIHLDGETSRDEPSLRHKTPWTSRVYQGTWLKGVTAGGCRNNAGEGRGLARTSNDGWEGKSDASLNNENELCLRRMTIK